MVRIQDNLGKLVPECCTILGFAAARDDGNEWWRLKLQNMCKLFPPNFTATVVSLLLTYVTNTVIVTEIHFLFSSVYMCISIQDLCFCLRFICTYLLLGLQ